MPGCSDSRTKSRTVFAIPFLLLALAAPVPAAAQSRGGARHAANRPWSNCLTVRPPECHNASR